MNCVRAAAAAVVDAGVAREAQAKAVRPSPRRTSIAFKDFDDEDAARENHAQSLRNPR